jgi:hypothetical protein
MYLSNYPDGVTGNEYAIAGPDKEWDEDHYCEKCDKTTTFGCESFQKQRSGICSECGSDLDLGHSDDYIDWEDVADQREDLEEYRNEMGW